MIFRDLIQTGVRTLNTNAPVILTAFGAVGVTTTAVLAARASFEAARRITIAEIEEGRVFTKQEKVKLVWPLYIGAVSSGVVTTAAVVLSHRVSARRAAALAAAYTMSNDRLEEYQEKIKEKLGVKKEKDARDELTQDRVNRDHKDGAVIFSPLDGKVMIKEDYTGRTFWSSIDEINKAVNEVNAQINKEGSVRVSDFYDTLGLEHVATSDYFGWTHDDRLELEWSTATTPDKQHAIHVFEYVNHPVMNPEREVNPFR